jgi:phospholipase D1/2
MPVNHAPNSYDWGSEADLAVADPLSTNFLNNWNTTARVNTSIFSKAFHVVPDDSVRTWQQYEAFYQHLFVSKSKPDDRVQIPARYEYGHVVKEEFPKGVEELKEWLAGIRGSLVEMPLKFMDKVDFAEEGLKLNALTDEVYT